MKMYDTPKFFVLIRDNASNMQKAFKLVKHEFPHVEGLGCIAHSLHLLFNDICKTETISNLKKTCQLIVRSIKASQVLLATLKKHAIIQNINVALKLLVTTRWGSFLFCLESLTKNKDPLQALAIDNNIVDTLKKELKNVLLDDSFWEKVTAMVDIFTPIVHAIHIVESNKPIIHKVFNLINNVENTIKDQLFISPLSWDETLLVKENILSRRHFILKDIHLAAYFLDPDTRGKNLSASQNIDTIEYICNVAKNMNLDVMCDLANYQSNQSVWAKPFLWENLDKIEPIDWWKLLSRCTDLSKVAIKILTAPDTSTATERSFSTYSWIHSKRRNRLTNDRAGKLCAIAYNHKLQHLKNISNSPNFNLNNSNKQTKENEPIDIESPQEKRFESESEEESASSIIYMDTETEEEEEEEEEEGGGGGE